MEIHKSLQNIGLSDKQSKVYIACLQLGIDTVLNISRYSNLKRSTTYVILDELELMGLVSKTKKEKKNLYKAEDPKLLLAGIRSKRDTIDDVLPALKAIYNIDPEKPNIKIGEGIRSVRNAYANIFTYLYHHPQEELLIYGSLKDALEHFETQVLDIFYENVARTKNPVREIANDDYQTRKYYKKASELNPNHEIRFIKNEGRFHKTDNMLYGNNLVVFSVQEQIFATTIEAGNIAESYRTMFNLAWKSAQIL